MQNHDANLKEDTAPGAVDTPLFAAGWRLLKSEAWLFGVILVALFAVEIGLRLARPELADLIYAPDMTGGHPIVVTEESYRIPANAPPPYGRTRILALGDSTTFGTGIAAEETWPLLLNTQLSDGITVRNAGIEGSDLRQLEFGFDTIWGAPESPDVVLLLVTGNMVSFHDFLRNEPLRDPRTRAMRLRTFQGQKGLKRTVVDAVQSSALWKGISLNVTYGKYALGLLDHRTDPHRPLSPLMAYGWLQPDLIEDRSEIMWHSFENGLQSLRDHMAAQGACLVVGFLPPRFMLSNHWLDNLKSVPKTRLRNNAGARVHAIAERLNLPYAPTETALRDMRRANSPSSLPLYIPGDYTHLDPDGHGVIAKTFALYAAPILQDEQACQFTDTR